MVVFQWCAKDHCFLQHARVTKQTAGFTGRSAQVQQYQTGGEILGEIHNKLYTSFLDFKKS